MTRPLRSARGRTVTFLAIAIFSVPGSGSAAEPLVTIPEFVAGPLPRNGDFSRYQSHGRPAEWNPAVESGKHDFRLDPVATGREFLLPPSAAVIATRETGRAYYFQEVPLLPGEYRLQVETSGTVGAKSQIAFATEGAEVTTGPMDLAEDWKRSELSLTVPQRTATIRLYADSQVGGIVRFRRVRLDPVRLKSSPVPFEDGTHIAGIVLPPDPTAAESFACCELQSYLHRMTGKTPGLKGRDYVEQGFLLYLGRAADAGRRSELNEQPADSYLIHGDDRGLHLAGNTDTGTLYAVYDFLKQQGCRWALPGNLGEVVPERKSLLRVADRVEIPDFDIRGFYQLAQDFFPGPDLAWIYFNIDDHFDWALRNRLNAFWVGGASLDFGAHRGHGWVQDSGHSFNASIAPHATYFKDHPDWYPLVNGKRMPVSDISPQLPNQLCVSNPELRDYTVELARTYFRDHPRAMVFAMNPMDGPNYNCECDACRALDPPGFEWKQDFSGFPVFPNLKLPPLSDRYLSYVNYVAERLAQSHPDKLIEFYTYASREPPVRERVAPNVMVKYIYLTGRAVNVSLMNPHDSKAHIEQRHLAGWRDAGSRHLAYYNYGDWEHPNAPLFWYFQISDLLQNLHRHYGCRSLMGETHTQVQNDPVWYAVMSQTLWNTETDYRQVIRDFCHSFYGASGPDLMDYYLLMDQAILASEAGKRTNYHPNAHWELSLEQLGRGNVLLDRALAKAGNDERLKQRIDLVRLSHAILTHMRSQNETTATQDIQAIRQTALERANALRSDRGFVVKLPTARSLKPVSPSNVP